MVGLGSRGPDLFTLRNVLIKMYLFSLRFNFLICVPALILVIYQWKSGLSFCLVSYLFLQFPMHCLFLLEQLNFAKDFFYLDENPEKLKIHMMCLKILKSNKKNLDWLVA